jgi:pyruvate dehydrogenase E1 component alpha subunit
MSDPATYRSKEEVADYKKIDPLETTKATILANGYATEAELDKMEEDIMAEVDASVVFAEESPYPQASDLFRHVYVEDDYPYITD